MANPRTIARLQERIKERAAYCLQFEINELVVARPRDCDVLRTPSSLGLVQRRPVERHHRCDMD